MRHWRVVVHALDRTGPPVLALAFLRWLSRNHPDHRVDVVAVRGGPLIDEMAVLGRVTVLLEPHAPGVPEELSGRAPMRARLEDLPPADATLLVSVAAGQALPLLPPGPLVVWSVEAGQDLHWLDGPTDLRRRPARWLAGSRVTEGELGHRLDPDTPVHLVPEFIDVSTEATAPIGTGRRLTMGAEEDELLVVGAGIGTWRKGLDLFLEAAVAHQRAASGSVRYAWIGGTEDELHPLVRSEARRLMPHRFLMLDSVDDIDAHLAAADVLVHPARLDSFPLICLHAAAAGTPVVAFEDAGGVPEMFGDAFVGVPYPDVAALARAAERLRDQQLRAAAATAQRERVLRHFTADAAAPTVLENLAAACDEWA